MENKTNHYDSLFQLYMTMEDVKALKLAVLGTTDVAGELCTRCNNIIEEVNNHLKKSNFTPPKKLSIVKNQLKTNKP